MIDLYGKKFVYYIPPTGWVKGKGHRVAIVVENESGYYPSGGGDKEPWYWGNGDNAEVSFKEANLLADEFNVALGVSIDEALEVLSSSMKASRKEGKL